MFTNQKKVGIPRALLYYYFFPLWKTFFENIGAEIVLSGQTTKAILNSGLKQAVDEACLPVKLAYGHVIDLIGKVDYIFIPRLVSIGKNEYICPKFLGFPDMIRHNINGLPEIIDENVNLYRKDRHLFKTFQKVGLKFTGSQRLIKKAFQKAVQKQKEYENLLQEGYLPTDALEIMARSSAAKVLEPDRSYNLLQQIMQPVRRPGQQSVRPPVRPQAEPLAQQPVQPAKLPASAFNAAEPLRQQPLATQAVEPFAAQTALRPEQQQSPQVPLKVALIGHPYNIYDSYISMNLIARLNEMGVRVVTAETVPVREIEYQAAKLPKRLFWTLGKKMIGAAFYYLEQPDIDGIIHLAAFGCGPDSMTGDIIERNVRRKHEVPLLSLTLDEHTGEAGIVTRLEAFLDMIQWRQRDENNLPSHG